MISLAQAQPSDRLMKATTGLTVVYYKAYPTQDLMGLLFGFSQGQVSDWVRRLTATVGRLLPLHKPARQVRELRYLLAREPALQGLRLPKEVTVLADHGFAGLDPGAAVLITPWKKPKGWRLHWKRRAFNRLLARKRVQVDLRDEFRNRRKGMVDAVMEIGCTLHNYRWTCRQGTVA